MNIRKPPKPEKLPVDVENTVKIRPRGDPLNLQKFKLDNTKAPLTSRGDQKVGAFQNPV